jgi:hypothetical protein
MTKKRSDAPSQARRYETIAGLRVTIIKRGEVETVRGGPKCRWCGKSLRPIYVTKRAAKETRHYFDKRPKHVPATFDESRAQWLVVSTAFGIVSRTFQGSFGAYGDNHFCGLNCARDYAVGVVDGLLSNSLRLIDHKGHDTEPRKSTATTS